MNQIPADELSECLRGCVQRGVFHQLKTLSAGTYELSVLAQAEHFSTLGARSNAGTESGKKGGWHLLAFSKKRAVSVGNN